MRSLLLLPLAIAAAPPLPAAEPLTVEHAVEIALAHNPRIEALQHQLAEDRTLVDAANPIPNPELRIGTASHGDPT
ncbi:MAG: hypothetical protein JXR83_19480, partial [Deltaproteobacteria bacterium]|nr:hypothetical protein [Deltaproteobacteria bacterium]